MDEKVLSHFCITQGWTISANARYTCLQHIPAQTLLIIPESGMTIIHIYYVSLFIYYKESISILVIHS
jgi:hypothetical protein